MSTYVIFDKNTGAIVHTHTEVSIFGEPLPVAPDELLAMYRPRPGHDRSNLDVLEVDRDLLRRGQSNRTDLYVDVQKRVISERPAKTP